MNRQIKFSLLLIISLISFSCSDTLNTLDTPSLDTINLSAIPNDTSEVKAHVLCFIDEFEEEGTITRTYADPSNNYAVTWSDGDIVGIFPREGYQEPFVIPANQVGKTWAAFDGGYWAMKDGLTYNAYYPFDKANFESANSKTTIPVTYIGQEQNGTACCVGPFDYTYSDWTAPDNGSISFNFHHLGSFLVLTLPLPATATYTSLTLNADQAVIPTRGTYDLTAATPSFVADQESLASSLTMSLINYQGTAGDDAIFYMMLPPVDLSARDLTVTLTTADASCTFDIDAFNSIAGTLKKKTGTPRSSTIEGTIDDWLYLASIIRVKTPGSLNTHFTSADYTTTTELRIAGDINSTDINYLHNFTNLELLDMNRATIVESGKENTLPNKFSYYYDDGDTEHYLTKLKTLYLPQSLVTIEYNALAGLESLEYVKIYDNVSTTLASRFTNDLKLTEIEVTSGNATYASYNGCLYTKDYTTLIHCPAAKTSVNFHSGVTTIGEKAFYCTSVPSVTVPEGVSALGNQAFLHDINVVVGPYGNLSTIVLPSTIQTIGNQCFGYQNITSITIPEGVQEIPTECFKGSKLATITLATTISSYGSSAFENSLLTTINIPNGPTSIPYALFRGCRALTDITFPASATSIGHEALRGCSSLETIHCSSYLNNNRAYDNIVGIKSGCQVYVPTAKLTNYQNDAFWSASVFNLIGE